MFFEINQLAIFPLTHHLIHHFVILARSRIGGEEYFGHVDMTESVALLSVKRILILSDSGDELLLLHFKQIKHVEVQEEEGKHAVVFLLKTQTPSCEDFEVVKCPDRRTADMLCKELARVAGITVGEM